MARKVVSKLTYYSFTILFHSLCLSGLIWQIAQISVNFFQFDVLTDIKIFTPEESKWREKVVYVCFYDWQLKNSEILAKLNLSHSNTLTTGQKFKTRLTSEQIFVSFKVNTLRRKYALCFRLLYLFSISIHYRPTLYFNAKVVSDIKQFMVSIGHESNSFDHSRDAEADTDWINTTKVFTVTSNSFNILKLESPYSDHCFSYPDIGLRDRNDAIATCESNQTHVSPNKVVRETDLKILNSYTTADGPKCVKTRFQPDCNQRLFLTRLTTGVLSPSSKNSKITFAPDTDASLSVVSKPKIDDIDYVTYILGALGSWIGFSFVGINPIPHLLKMPNEAKVIPINHNICKSRFRKIKLDSIKKTQEINTIKYTISRMINYMESQANQS